MRYINRKWSDPDHGQAERSSAESRGRCGSIMVIHSGTEENERCPFMLSMFSAQYAVQTGETSRDTLTDHSYTTAKIRITKRIPAGAGFGQAG